MSAGTAASAQASQMYAAALAQGATPEMAAEIVAMYEAKNGRHARRHAGDERPVGSGGAASLSSLASVTAEASLMADDMKPPTLDEDELARRARTLIEFSAEVFPADLVRRGAPLEPPVAAMLTTSMAVDFVSRLGGASLTPRQMTVFVSTLLASHLGALRALIESGQATAGRAAAGPSN